MVVDVLNHPSIWTDGSGELIPHLDVKVAGAGAFVHSPALSLTIIDGDMLRILMADLRVAPTFSLRLSVRCSLFKELSIGV